MAIITVVLQDERGVHITDVVGGCSNVIDQCLPGLHDSTYCCLRFVDPYGNTIFNHFQAQVILEEWERVKSSFINMNALQLWNDVRQLIAFCAEEYHIYLCFIGD